MYLIPETMYLEHHGVLGMKWGVHREANKDAVEFARAKMYYGQGAGNRRKLINATVTAKSAKDPVYKQAFEDALAKQDMAKRASEARGKRHRTDAVQGTAKTVRGIKNTVLGNPAYASTAAVLLVAGYGVAKKTGVDQVILKAGKEAFSSAKTSARAFQIKQQFKKNGWN